MTVLMMLLVSAGVGWLAQSCKGRRGVVWGFISFLLMLPVWIVIYFSTAMDQPSPYKLDEGWYALGIMVAGAVGIVMAFVVATLPPKSGTTQQQVPLKKCPFCAEEIKLEARVCRFCGRDMPDVSLI